MALEKSIGGSWFAKYEHNCKHDIAESYVAALTMNELLNLAASPDKARERLLNLKLGYSDRFGLTELREALSTLYGKDVKADNVITGHGGVGANQIAYSSVFEPGDNLICIMPTYQQLNSLPKLIGYEVREYWLRPENNYDIEYDVIREMMDERTKMISLTNPNNPSGRLFSRDELARLGDVARERTDIRSAAAPYEKLETLRADTAAQLQIGNVYAFGRQFDLFALPRQFVRAHAAHALCAVYGRNLLDFADLEHFALALLKNERVRADVRGRYKYVFADEYQDTNGVQEALLAGEDPSRYLVGKAKENAHALQAYFGNFSGVFPPPKREGDLFPRLLYREKDGVYYTKTLKCSLSAGKIENLTLV